MDGHIIGQLWIPHERFRSIGGLSLVAMHRFHCADDYALVFESPSPLAKLDPLPFLDVEHRDGLNDRLEEAWNKLVDSTTAAMDRARCLTPNVRLRLDPFRLEGQLQRDGQRIVLLFSALGNRACVASIDDRALAYLPVGPRVVVRVPQRPDLPVDEEMLQRAIEQAEGCLGPEAKSTILEHQRTADLVSRDLAPDPILEPVGHAKPPRTPPAAASDGAISLSLDLLGSDDLPT